MFAVLFLLAAAACGRGPAPEAKRSGSPATPAILETIGDTALVPLEATGFENLTRAERATAYYLMRATVAGRDLEIEAPGDPDLEVRDLLEEILTHPRSLDPEFRKSLLDYLKRVWIHDGSRDRTTGRKIVPGFTFEALRAGAQAAQTEGAEIRLAVREALPAKLERLRPAIFDDTPPVLPTCRDRHGPAAARMATRRPGGPRPDGPAATRRTLTGFLAKAAAFAGEPQRADLLRLADALRQETPDPAALGLEAWLRLDASVGTIQGPVPACAAVHGRQGSWRGLVWAGDPDRSRRLQALATGTGVAAAAADVLAAVGALGPISPTLLVAPENGTTTGSGETRCLLLTNVLDATDRALLAPLVEEFAHPEDRALLRERGAAASFLLAAMHAVRGHAGGIQGRETEGPPTDARGVLVEARADLRALGYLLDPPDGAPVETPDGEAAARLYVARGLAALRAVPDDDRIMGDEARARHLVVFGLRERGMGIDSVLVEGRTFLRLASLERMREGVAGLLEEVEGLLAGDGATAPALVERLATRTDASLREEIASRARKAGIPLRLACVMPDLVPVRDAAGEVIDARVGPPPDFGMQMLRYSGKLPFETGAPR